MIHHRFHAPGLALLACSALVGAVLLDPARTRAGELVLGEPGEAPWSLLPQAEVTSEGIFLKQLVALSDGQPLPHLRIGEAPAVGQVLTLTRAQLREVVQRASPGMTATNWTGADRIRIGRRMRRLAEPEIKGLLASELQRAMHISEGELELKWVRPWSEVQIPDEAVSLRLVDFPPAGLAPSFTVRFELLANGEAAGSWPVALTARLWQEIPVAVNELRRGDPVREEDAQLERRDILKLRSPITTLANLRNSSEYSENVAAGSPLLSRSIRPRPIVLRGQTVNALLVDRSLQISLKVEVLENGLPGQVIRVRNIQSKRELRAKVSDEQTVLLQF